MLERPSDNVGLEARPGFPGVLIISKANPLRQHDLLKPHIPIEPMPIVILDVDSDVLKTNLGASCSVLEFADVVLADDTAAEELKKIYFSKDAFFKRFPKTKAIVQNGDNSRTVYMPAEVYVLEDFELQSSKEQMDSLAQSISDNPREWQENPDDVIKNVFKADKKSESATEETWNKTYTYFPEFKEIGALDPKEKIRDELREAIGQGNIPPFVYTYPPRSAYRELLADVTDVTIDDIWEQDRETSPTEDVSLYIHYPFCKYKCGFCNLYTVSNAKEEAINRYTGSIVKQLRQSEGILEGRKLVTIYIGGGTPMLMSPGNFDQIVDAVSQVVPNWTDTVDEFCMEASPDSVVNGGDKVVHFIDRGLTRANLGLQSTTDEELLNMGRPVSAKLGWQAIDVLKQAGLANLSTDLIMGFQDQTEESWIKSVKELLAKDPETISTYFLTVRPDNRFGRTGRYTFYRDPKLYRWYDRAREMILDQGYVPDSNVRYKKPEKGGYKQKVYQFHGVPILGIGAGARSYTNTADYIIGGDSMPSLKQINAYIHGVETDANLIKAGYIYDDEERIRKRFTLDLFDIDLNELSNYDINQHLPAFQPLLDVLVEEGLAARQGTRYSLTDSGYKYRDIVSWMFFSPRVIQNDTEFYRSLQQGNLVTPG